MRFPRLTIARIMGLVLISALGFLAARTWLPSWQRPALPQMGDSQLYESASPSDDLAIEVGPNVFRVGSVVRNDRDGSVRVEDGLGKALPPLPSSETAALVAASPWLDVAQVRLEGDPSRIEVGELRVFDHATRVLIGKAGGGFGDCGASEVAPGVYQLCRIGGPLPDRVDVWFRSTSHPAHDEIFRLPARAGASVSYAMGIVSIAEVRKGRLSYTLKEMPGQERPVIQWQEEPGSTTDRCSLVLDWTGGDYKTSCQIVAVGRDGSKRHPYNQRNFSLQTKRHVFEFPIDPDRIDHLEFRLSQNVRTFYFEGVELPRIGGGAFSPPPIVKVPVDGKLGRTWLAEFAPLRVELEMRDGSEGTITEISADHFGISAGAARRLPGSLDALLRVDGLSDSRWRLNFLGEDGKPLDLRRSRSNNFSASGDSHYRGVWGYDIPLKNVRSVEVSAPRG